MKKSLIFVIAIVLIMSLCVSFVACDNNKPTVEPDNSGTNQGGNNNKPNDPADSGVTPTELTQSEILAQNKLLSYTNAWLVNNYSESFDANGLKTQLTAIRDANVIKNISVGKLDANTQSFKLNLTFKSGATSSIDVKREAVDQGVHAGVDQLPISKNADADKVIGAVVTAALKNVKNAIAEGKDAFAESGDGFGFSGKAYFQFNYGDLTDGLVDAALAVRGNIAPEAKDTFAALEILIEDEVIGGLYYDGQATQEATKIYLYINYDGYTQKLYINNADINAIVNSFMGGADVALADDADVPFYEKEFESLTELLGSFEGASSFAGIVSPIVAAVIGARQESVTGGTHYQLIIDVDDLLNTLMDSLSTVLAQLDLSSLPAPLNQLDLSTFQGVGGALVIDAVVDSDSKALSSLEISYNCAQKDFRFNKDDTEAKIYGPINFALGIKDFSLGEQDRDSALKINQEDALDGFNYFSPLNAELSADFVVTATGTAYDGSYSATLKSDINPFVLDQGQMEINVIKDDEQFINAYFDIEWDDVILTLTYGSDVYHGSLRDVAWGEKFGKFASFAISDQSILYPIVNYVNELINIFGGSTAAADDAVVEEAPSFININMDSISKAFGIKDAMEELIAEWKKVPAILDYKFAGAEKYFHIELGSDEYNQVLNLVKENLVDLLPILANIPEFDKTAAIVTVDWNYKNDANKAIVTVEYADNTYVALVDYSNWESGKIVDVTFTMNVDGARSVYAGKVDLSKWESEGVCHITYDVTKGTTTTNYVDFTLTYKKGEISTIVLKLTGEKVHTYTFTGAIADGVGTYTANLDGVELKVYGGNGSFTLLDDKTSFGIPTFEVGCMFGFDFPGADAKVELNSLKLVSYGEEVEINAPSATEGKDVGILVDVVVDALIDIFTK